jgi:predicted type IV restriction endonuclease
MIISEKVALRINIGLKKLQPIVEAKKKQDINESDTVNLIRDILSEILGFDKYEDITTEHLIRGTYCDLAVKINGKIKLLIEAKAIGIELKPTYVKQVVDYAVNDGIDWVILSNAVTWKVFKVIYSKPIHQELVCEINFLDLNNRHNEDIEKIGVLSKESISKCSLDQFYSQKQATSKYVLGNLICAESVVNFIRKELRQVFPDIKVNPDEIRNVLLNEVIKREILEGDDYEDAKRKIARVYKKREKSENKEVNGTNQIETTVASSVNGNNNSK